MRRIYLDFNASTPLHPAAEELMRTEKEAWGNPSSGHWAAERAGELLERGRGSVAELLGCGPERIVFTSGGSEANNFALKGRFFACSQSAPHIITSTVEHPSILAPCKFLATRGARVTYLPVDARGFVDPEALRRAICPQTILVSIMHANNETGVIQPIAACAAIAHERGVPFHTDAAQSVGKIATLVDDLGVDLLTVAGHKLYAPKGIGALYIRSGMALEPLIHGAGHEQGRRAGTESALLVAAFGIACSAAKERLDGDDIRALRDRFWRGLEQTLGERVVLNGDVQHRLPNTLNVSFLGHNGDEIVARLSAAGVAASAGSACHSGTLEISPVLRAMGVSERVGRGAVRFSLGRETTAQELDEVLEHLARALAH